MPPAIVVFTDGACINGITSPPGSRFGGVGVYFEPPYEAWSVSEPLGGSAEEQTNNRAELTALVVCLEVLRDNAEEAPLSRPVTIYTDSAYCQNAVLTWSRAWRRNAWRTASGAPVKNRDLIERLLALYEERLPAISLLKVKGHSGDPGNDAADRLATQAALRAATRASEASSHFL
jgi:ribonuclease HI